MNISLGIKQDDAELLGNQEGGGKQSIQAAVPKTLCQRVVRHNFTPPLHFH